MAIKGKLLPRVIISNWWNIRRKLIETPDFSMTPKNIAEFLNISINTVFSNIYSGLRQFELIDKKGNLTERGNNWLNDEMYKDVCTDIIESIYPVELIDSIKDPINNRQSLTEWFIGKTHARTNVILQMTATYLLLCKGDPQEPQKKAELKKVTAGLKTIEPKVKRVYRRKIKPETSVIEKTTAAVKDEPPAIVEIKQLQKAEEVHESSMGKEAIHVVQQSMKPVININVQMTITSETPNEQIITLFASIGKYLFA